MRLSSILLPISSALLACHVAATASKLASVPHIKPRGNSVGHSNATNQLRGAVREEERSPSLSEQHSDLDEMMRFLWKTSPSFLREIKKEPNLSKLYSNLKGKFGRKRFDEALKLGVKLFEKDKDMVYYELFQLLQLRNRPDKLAGTLQKRSKAEGSKPPSPRVGRQGLENDELEKKLKALSLGVTEGTHPKTADPQVVLQKLSTLVDHPKLPMMSLPRENAPDRFPPAYGLELLFLDQKLNEMFPTEEEMETVSKVVAEQLERRDGKLEMFFIHLNAFFGWKHSFGEKFKEEVIANSKT